MGINSFTLKMIAVASMLIDHIGLLFFPQYAVFEIIGRIAFPIFAYTLVEGFIHTHDVKKYILRMTLLAFLSEIPFDLAISGKVLEFTHQNVFFTLTLGLVMLCVFWKSKNPIEKYTLAIVLFLISEFLNTDYNSMGLLMILCFYLFRDRVVWKNCSIAFVSIFLMGYMYAFGALALIPIAFHNREQGPRAKAFFYSFYPVHLFVLFLIKMII